MPNYLKKEAIALEVGWRKETPRQVLTTLKRIKSRGYGLVVTDSELKLDDSRRVVFVPLKIFLLMTP